MIDKIVRDIRTQTFEPISAIQEKLDYFRNYSRRGFSSLSDHEYNRIREEFRIFYNVHVAFAGDTYPDKLFRITNNKRVTGKSTYKLQHISNLLGPPISLARQGRCNLSNESVFYSALDFQTAIWETQPNPGDYITLSQWRIKEGQALNNHSIFHPSETNLNRESKATYEAHLKSQELIHPTFRPIFSELMKFMAEEFMKPVAYGATKEYLLSSLIASQFLERPSDENGYKIDSVSYPSTKVDHKITNLAIRNSLVLEKLDLVSASIFTVGETNYDVIDKEREDLIKISSLITHAKTFDFHDDRIYYDLERELRDAMEIHNNKR